MDELPTYDSHLLPFCFYLFKSHVLTMEMPTKKIHHKLKTLKFSIMEECQNREKLRASKFLPLEEVTHIEHLKAHSWHFPHHGQLTPNFLGPFHTLLCENHLWVHCFFYHICHVGELMFIHNII
jgi:hypothetical protein